MLKAKTLVVAGLLLVSPVLVSAQLAGSVEYLLNYARTYLAEGKPTSAASYAKEALALDPSNAEALAIIQKTQGPNGLAPARQPAVSAASPSWGGGVGSAEYFLQYARDFLKAGNFSSAVAYAEDALKVDSNNNEARAIIRAANQRKAPATVVGRPQNPSGNSDQIGSVAYLLKYAKHHMANGSNAGAADYARQALKVDPSSAEAKQILKLTDGRPDKSASSNSCQDQFSTCWVGAQTYTPGSGYKADPMARQQCMVERNRCNSIAN